MGVKYCNLLTFNQVVNMEDCVCWWVAWCMYMQWSTEASNLRFSILSAFCSFWAGFSLEIYFQMVHSTIGRYEHPLYTTIEMLARIVTAVTRIYEVIQTVLLPKSKLY